MGVVVGADVGVGVGVMVGADITVGVTVGVEVGVSVLVGVAVGSIVGVGVCVGSIVGVAVGTSVGVAVGATGSRGDDEFCGSGIFLNRKSFSLLSVSSPFPKRRSTPVLIDAMLDVEFARRSLLVPATGFVSVAVSLSIADPNPTLSTIVVPASPYRMTVLLEVIVSSVEYCMSAEVEPSYSDDVIKKNPCDFIVPERVLTRTDDVPAVVFLASCQLVRLTSEDVGL